MELSSDQINLNEGGFERMGGCEHLDGPDSITIIITTQVVVGQTGVVRSTPLHSTIR